MLTAQVFNKRSLKSDCINWKTDIFRDLQAVSQNYSIGVFKSTVLMECSARELKKIGTIPSTFERIVIDFDMKLALTWILLIIEELT